MFINFHFVGGNGNKDKVNGNGGGGGNSGGNGNSNKDDGDVDGEGSGELYLNDLVWLLLGVHYPGTSSYPKSSHNTNSFPSP